MKIPIITEFELKRVVKKKWFIISTILTPVFVIFYAAFPAIMGKLSQKERVLGIIDRTGIVIQEFQNPGEISGKVKKFKKSMGISSEPKELKALVRFKIKVLNSLDEGKKLLDEKKLDGVLFIEKDFFEKRRATLYMRNVADAILSSLVKSRLNRVSEKFQLKKLGLSPEVLNEILKGVKLKTLKFEKGKVKKETMESVFTMYMVFSMLLFMGLIGYGQILLRRVIEDKRSRIVEVLYSSATPYQIFMGKLLGVGIAGIIQLGFWLLLGAIGYFYASSLLPGFNISSFFPKFLIFLLFFFSGFFLYSTIFLTIGSIVETEEDAQHLMGPIMMAITLPFALSFILMMTPESWITILFSYFPYTAPYFMMMRSIISAVPAVEIIISVLLITLTSMASVWASARIFRVGMLHTGKRPTIPEVIRWIKKG